MQFASNCMSCDVKAKSETLPIHVHKQDNKDKKIPNTIKINIDRNLGLDISDIYKLKINNFEYYQIQYMLLLYKNIIKAIEITGIDNDDEQVDFVWNLLRGYGFHVFENSNVHSIKNNRGLSVLPKNTTKLRADKHKESYSDFQTDTLLYNKNFMIHGDVHYFEECKVLK